jgi:hypothetical protein
MSSDAISNSSVTFADIARKLGQENFKFNKNEKVFCSQKNKRKVYSKCPNHEKCDALYKATSNRHFECYKFLLKEEEDEEYEFYFSIEDISRMYVYREFFDFFEYIVDKYTVNLVENRFTHIVIDCMNDEPTYVKFVERIFNDMEKTNYYNSEDKEYVCKKIITKALQVGNIKVLEFLHEKFPQYFTPEIILSYISNYSPLYDENFETNVPYDPCCGMNSSFYNHPNRIRICDYIMEINKKKEKELYIIIPDNNLELYQNTKTKNFFVVFTPYFQQGELGLKSNIKLISNNIADITEHLKKITNYQRIYYFSDDIQKSYMDLLNKGVPFNNDLTNFFIAHNFFY